MIPSRRPSEGGKSRDDYRAVFLATPRTVVVVVVSSRTDQYDDVVDEVEDVVVVVVVGNRRVKMK